MLLKSCRSITNLSFFFVICLVFTACAEGLPGNS